MSLSDEVLLIRRSVAISRLDHVFALSITGDEAEQALEQVVPSDLRLIDGQIRHTMVLDSGGLVQADLLVCRHEDDLILLGEGPSELDVVDMLSQHLPKSVRVTGLSSTKALLGLNGPYAWELLNDIYGPGAGSIPYLTHFADRAGKAGHCFRAGNCGEYGYLLLIDRDGIGEMESRLLDRGARLDLGWAGLEALDQCALENWFFNPRKEGRSGLTPLDLQLQWRISSRKSFLGSEALKRARLKGIGARTTCLIAPAAIERGHEVWHDDRRIGQVLNSGYSPVLQEWVGMALLEMPFAQPGIDAFQVDTGGNCVPVRTVAPPVINNRSLYVDPRRHRYASRETDRFPPLV